MKRIFHLHRRDPSAALAGLLASVALTVSAAPTQISNVPISSTFSAQAKPNVMLLMDTSESMAFTHMPDEVEDLTLPTSVGYKNWQCNAIYYNPNSNVSYSSLPRRYDGTFFPSGDFGNALVDAFDASSLAKKNLANEFQAYDNGANGAATQSVRKPTWPQDPPQAAYYYVYEGNQQLSYGRAPCNDADTGADRPATGGGMWRRILVGPGEQARFANWYVYNRTRISLAKTAISLSFNALNDSHRVGFITVDPKVGSPSFPAVNPEKFLAVNDFSGGAGNQRDLWYAKLFAQKPSGTSPAREGLARVGRYYGNKFDGINAGMGGVDPMQYSCQQNFTIMTTDGYWNAQRETKPTDLGGGMLGGPVDLAGIALVGNQDGTLTALTGNTPPGVWDGFAESVRRETDRLNTFSDIPCAATGVTYASQTQTRASYRAYTETTTQYEKTTHQLKSRTRYDSIETNIFAQSSKQYELYTDQYNTQTLTFATIENQSTYRVVPFTTKTTTYWATGVKQLSETTSTVQRTETPWTRRVTEQYRTIAEQWSAATHVDRAKTSVYRRGQQRVMVQYYQIIKTDAEHERGALAESCDPQPGVVDCERENLGPPVPTAGVCVEGASSGSPKFIITDCTDILIAPVVPIATTCAPGTVIDPTSPYVRTTCEETVVSAEAPVTACTGPLTLGPNSEVTTCYRQVLQAAAPFDTTSGACPNGQNPTTFVTTVCTPGPLAHGAQGSAACTGTQFSGSPNFVTTTCLHDGPTTTYVAPGNCTDQTGTSQNGWLPNVMCTPGNTVGPQYAAGCSPTTLGTVGTASAIDVTCSAPMDETSGVVASCTAGQPGVTFDSAPPYTRRECTTAGPIAHPLMPSAECQEGVIPAGPPFFAETTCVKNGPIVTYVPRSTDCQLRVADANNGGETTSCFTPPEGQETDGPCTPGATGSGSNQATVVCGSRNLQETPVATCDVNAPPVDLGNGVFSRCSLVVGSAVSGPNCGTPGTDTYNPNPPYTGSRCNRVQLTRFVDPPCVDGSDIAADGNNDWTRSVCNVRNQTGSIPVASCNPAVIGISAGPNFVNTSCTKTAVPALTGPFNGTCTAGPSFDGSKTTVCSQTYSSAQPVPVETCALGVGTFRETGSPYGQVTCTDLPPNEQQVFVPSLDPSQCTAISTKTDPEWKTVDCETLSSTDYSAQCTDGDVTNSGAPLFKRTVCSAPQPTVPVADNCSDGVTYDSTTRLTKSCTVHVVSALQPANCSPSSPPAAPVGPDWITTLCTLGSGTGFRRQYTQTETVKTGRYSGLILVGPEVTSAPTTITSADVDGGVCHVDGINPLPALPAPERPTAGMPSGCAQWPCVAAETLDGGSKNSLADVAQYYYVTDLRPGMVDDVPFSGVNSLDDRLTTQHMTTFSIALGVSGTLGYRTDYRNPAGDFAGIVVQPPTKAWPEWPDRTVDYLTPSGDGSTGARRWEDERSIDDFWHAATNGRGRYFSAKDPGTAAAGVTDALLGIGVRAAVGSAAGVTTLEPVVNNNSSFEASYRTSVWSGDVVAKRFDLSSGISTASSNWTASAGTLLQNRVKGLCDSRKIYLLRPTPPLVDFAYGTTSCDAQGDPGSPIPNGLTSSEILANFGSTAVQAFSQYLQMTDLNATAGTKDQKTPARGANLVNFIRGQTGFEGFLSGDDQRLYRRRESPLGDIVNAQPVYVKAPFATYSDPGYSQYKTDNVNRTPVVYVAANDGMLHAFHAGNGLENAVDPDGGKELWAVVPSTVLPELYRLADNNYKNTHQFYVDGTPTVGDAFDIGDGQWKTLLVGGLNAGGRGYYALDVTDPLNPIARWEFTNVDLGLSFGKPIISKVKGEWVVMFTSGYNNASGKGFLFIVNAFTGALKEKIATDVGDSTTPSNLGQINNYVEDTLISNATLQVYGGDMLGNTWRFNVGATPPTATLLGTATDQGGTPQPITVRPELAELNGKPIVFVATGRLLGANDVADTQTQSIYGIVDTLPANTAVPVYPTLRSSLAPLAMTTADASVTRQIACTGSTVECGSTSGWVVNLPDSGERVNVDMKLALGTLVVGSNVPNIDACNLGGRSYFNYLSFATGLPVPGEPAVSQFLSTSLIVGFNVIKVQDGFKADFSMSKQEVGRIVKNVPIGTPGPLGKRISWREIPQQ